MPLAFCFLRFHGQIISAIYIYLMVPIKWGVFIASAGIILCSHTRNGRGSKVGGPALSRAFFLLLNPSLPGRVAITRSDISMLGTGLTLVLHKAFDGCATDHLTYSSNPCECFESTHRQTFTC